MSDQITVELIQESINVAIGDSIEVTVNDDNQIIVAITEAVGEKGNTGEGFPTGGNTNQFLKKKSNADFDTEWAGGGVMTGVTGNIVDNTDPSSPVVTQIQADWGITDPDVLAYIKNKPTLGTASAQNTNYFDPAGAAATAQGNAETYTATALADYSKTSAFDNVAFSGSYADLTGAPTALSSFSDDSTHRLVTDTEKSTWNGKQNALSEGTDYLNKTHLDATYLGIHAKADTAGNADTVTNGVYTTGADTVYLTPATAASTYLGIHAKADTAGTADLVVTNANLTGVITSVGNTTSIASQTGTGTTLVVDTSPTLVTPILGVAAYTTLSGGNITDSGLTAGRVTYAGTAGLLSDSANMTFDATNGLKLAAGSASALNLTSMSGTAVGGLLLGTDTNLYRSGANTLKTDDDMISNSYASSQSSAGANVILASLYNTSTDTLSSSSINLGASATKGSTISDVVSGASGAGWHDLVFSTSNAGSPIEGMRLTTTRQLQVWQPTAGEANVVSSGSKIDAGGGNISAWNASSLGTELYTSLNAASDSSGLETNATTGWSGVNTTVTSVDSSDTAPQTGTYSLKEVSTGGTSYAEYAYTATIGKRYKVSLWAKRGAQGTTQMIQNWVGFGTIPITLISSTTWTQYIFYVTATQAATIIRVYSGNTSGDTVYIDNVSIKEITGGDVVARGLFTGGGSSGLKITAAGKLSADKSLNLGSGNVVANSDFLYFDGNGDYATAPIGTWSELNSTANFTWSGWLNFDDIAATHYVLSKNVSGTNRILIIQTSSHFQAYVDNGAGNFGYFTLTGAVANGEWHHYAVVYDGSQATNATKLVIYLDGVAQTLTFSGTFPTATGDLSSVIGTISNTTSNSFLGNMKDWRIYSNALSSADVISVFQGSSSVATMVHRYKLNDVSANIADTGTNPQNIVLTGGTWQNKPYLGVGVEMPYFPVSLPANTTSQGGWSFGNDTFVYRTSAGAITAAGVSLNNGDVVLPTLGKTLKIKEGASGRMGQVALVAGTKAITITGVTTSSRAFVTLVTPNTTTLTTTYQAVCTANTLTLQANVAAGTINIADISVLNYVVFDPS